MTLYSRTMPMHICQNSEDKSMQVTLTYVRVDVEWHRYVTVLSIQHTLVEGAAGEESEHVANSDITEECM